MIGLPDHLLGLTGEAGRRSIDCCVLPAADFLPLISELGVLFATFALLKPFAYGVEDTVATVIMFVRDV